MVLPIKPDYAGFGARAPFGARFGNHPLGFTPAPAYDSRVCSAKREWRRGSESVTARHIFYTFGRILLRNQANSIISKCIENKPFGIRFGIRSSP